MKKTKIEWCDTTLNPVVGCPRGCEYCYARKMNDRFKWVEDFSRPQFFPERLKQLESKKPQSIFMDSMSDIYFWEPEFGEMTMRAIIANPQHKYIFLTKGKGKFPSGFGHIWTMRNVWELKNVFIGKTVDIQNKLSRFEQYDFLSIEPILEPIDISIMQHNLYLKLVIIGAETGNRKGKVIPKKEWIDDIVKRADEYGLGVFMKNSLKPIMGDDFRQDKLIWEVKNDT